MVELKDFITSLYTFRSAIVLLLLVGLSAPQPFWASHEYYKQRAVSVILIASMRGMTTSPNIKISPTDSKLHVTMSLLKQ
jgi:hypothetical protein